MGTEETPFCSPSHGDDFSSWREPRQPGRRDSWRKYEVNWKDGNRADAIVWHPVRNEGRVPCDGPSHEDDFLERTKAVREKKGRETVEENTR
jgi:hypothetical protein